MENKLVEIKIEVPAERADEVSTYLIGMGSGGVVTGGGEVDAFELSEDRKATEELKVYFPPEVVSEKVSELRSYLEGLGLKFGISVSDIKNDDWANKWKEFFKPERITDRIVVKPTWEAFEARGGDIVIEIDPGMAFGTGTHATTKGCLRLIEEVISKTRGGIETMLDVGTGSGILAIAATMLGVQRTIAIDVDRSAIKVAEENVTLNGVGPQVSVSRIKVDEMRAAFDLVVANIIAEELVRLSAPLNDRVLPGGSLILSGIITEKADMVKEAFKGLSLEKELTEGEWVSLLYKKGY